MNNKLDKTTGVRPDKRNAPKLSPVVKKFNAKTHTLVRFVAKPVRENIEMRPEKKVLKTREDHPILSGQHQNFALKEIKDTSKKDSFLDLKGNLFKFSLEMTIVALTFMTIGYANSSKYISEPKQKLNRYLGYLMAHPYLNQLVVDQLQIENITVGEEKGLITRVRAAALDPLTAGGAAQIAQTSSGAKDDFLVVTSDSVIMKPNFATKDAGKSRDIQEYTVKNGDSVSNIASSFGVSTQTILYENNLSDTDYIKPGQILRILPTTGIKHTVKSGETVSSIAKKYQVELEAVLEFNEIEIPDDIGEGEVLIIPEGKSQVPKANQSQIANYNRIDVKHAEIPSDFVGATGDLIWPLAISNITQRFWSRHKGVDISNGQRPQFWASQAGVVELSGWQAGYGNTVVINHGNGLKTRYGHASELYVTAGDKVTNGQIIGRVGNTGRVYGKTGNHLHFEVIKNGVKIDPVSATK